LTKLLSLLFIIVLSGCSANPNYYETSCNPADVICLALSIAKTATDSEPDKKCSDMKGENRKQCMAQVDLLKKHIKNASSKYNTGRHQE